MHETERFDAFLSQRVNLSQSRINRLDAHVEAVSNFFSRGNGEFGSRFVQVVPQGSYAHGTIINPVSANDEFDADILVEVEENLDWSAADYVQKLYEDFRGSGVYRDKVHRRSRCVLVDYANEFHLDAVPFVRRVAGAYITHRHEDRFELTDPEAFNEWLDEKNREANGNLVKALRLLKYLRDFKNRFDIKSVLLTILVGERVSPVDQLVEPGCYDDVPSTLRKLCLSLDDYLQQNAQKPHIADPGCPTESYDHRLTHEKYANFRDRFHFYAEKIDKAYAEEDPVRSLSQWTEIFGEDFRQVDVTVELSQKTALTAATERTEQQIDRDFGFPIRIDRNLAFKIRGRVVPRTGFRNYILSRQGNKVLKHMDIDFFVEKCDVPKPYDLYWKVVNRGEEAQDASSLRGEIIQDAGLERKRESTLYRGRHYVEAFVVKGGFCVARDRQSVIIQ
ncbi:SMODS domain-containing nucleotidyltransferase [Actinomycetospora sp. CA-101289]|uniref:SMODS domain-containing nucleotidyltransferase n=1 Tax=Actinomycetospora sp. CA-101289 TaxID=3239893 RepID=UPI003D969287